MVDSTAVMSGGHCYFTYVSLPRFIAACFIARRAAGSDAARCRRKRRVTMCGAVLRKAILRPPTGGHTHQRKQQGKALRYALGCRCERASQTMETCFVPLSAAHVAQHRDQKWVFFYQKSIVSPPFSSFKPSTSCSSFTTGVF